MTGCSCVYKFLHCSVSGKQLMRRFQSETSVLKFLRRSVDPALVLYYFGKYIEKVLPGQQKPLLVLRTDLQ